MGVGGQSHSSATLLLGKTRYPLYGWPGGLQGWSGRVWKTSPLPGFGTRTVQPKVSHYTDRKVNNTNLIDFTL